MGIEILLPPYISPQAEQPQLIDDSTSVFRPNQAPGIPQRVSFVEPRLQVKQSWKSLRGIERAMMMQAIARVQGKYGTLRAAVGYTLRGSFPDAEVLADPYFITDKWSPLNGTCTQYLNDYVSRQMSTAANSAMGTFATAVSAVTSGAAYVVRAFLMDGKNTSGNYRGPVVGSGAGLSNWCDARTIGSVGFMSKAFVTQTSTVTVSVVCNSTANLAGDYFDASYCSLSRCAMVNSSVAAGAMMVGMMPVSTTGLLLPDDLVCINGELKRITGSTDSDANGNAYMTFAPAMFRAPSSGDAVEIYQPIGRFILSQNPNWSNQFGVYMDLDLTLEAINQ